MSTQFDIVIKEGTALLSPPKDPYNLVEESVNIGISKGHIVKLSSSLGKYSAKHTFNAKGL